ncbi:uracil-DNA glycosylase [Chromohalobacter salexigens]|uniref:uracil-DNA glycosylase n=1 Tax=Chromohalobacter israelensis TaxID=141390 RepID=UPI0032E8C490
MSIDLFIDELSSYHKKNIFNPWGENCKVSDHHNSLYVRQRNLFSVLNACKGFSSIDLWVGRDLGWRGGRRTGLSLVDEFSLHSYGNSIGVADLSKATSDAPVKERTATEVELMVREIKQPLFFWNAFPYHPHKEGDNFSNRMHTKEELSVGLYFLEFLLDLISPRRVVSVGNDAALAVKKIKVESLKVRHPSYGGQTAFREQIRDIYGLMPNDSMKKNIPLFA